VLHWAFEHWLSEDEEGRVVINPDFSYLFSDGGRGGGKSEYVAEMLMLVGTQKPLKVLCAREFQNSIDDSVMSVLMRKGEEHFPGFYTIVNNEIRGLNGTLFKFTGLQKRQLGSVKSKDGFEVCWVEEGQYVSKKAWEVLDPTIRKDGSVMIITMNREDASSIIDQTFIQKEPPARTDRVTVNYTDNPFPIPKLIEKAENCKRNDPESYRHIWLGGLNSFSDAQIFHGKYRVAKLPINPPTTDLYFGADWSNGGKDPHTLVRCYIVNNTLYIDRAVFKNCDYDGLDNMWSSVKGSKAYVIRADSSHGDAIKGNGSNKFMRKRGYNVVTPKKLLVITGLRFLRSFDEIVIDHRLTEMIKEAEDYCWMTDKNDEIISKPEDKNNHGWDAIRYALQPLIAKGRKWN
jgi:phage terminase large subunit